MLRLGQKIFVEILGLDLFILIISLLIDYSLKSAASQFEKEPPNCEFQVKIQMYRNKKEILEAAKKDGSSLKNASEDLRNDKEVVLEAIKNFGYSLQYASEDLKNDKDFILEAVKRNGNSLRYATEEMKKHREIVLEAVKKEGYSLQYASEDLKNDKEVVLEAIKSVVYSLYYSSEDLKNDKEFILEAVKINGHSLHYATEDLKNDREIVLEAVKRNGSSLEYASEELKNDKEIVLESVKRNGSSLEYASEELKNDKEFILEAVKRSRNSLQYANEELKNDKEINKEIVLETIKRNGSSLKFVSEDLKNDEDVVLEAVKKNGSYLFFSSEKLKNDKEFFRKCCLTDRRAITQIGETLTNESLLARKLKKYGTDVERACEEFFEVERNKKHFEKGSESSNRRTEDIFFVDLCYELFKKKNSSLFDVEESELIEEGEGLMEERKQLNEIKISEKSHPLLFEKIQKWKTKLKLKDPQLVGNVDRLNLQGYNPPNHQNLTSLRSKRFQDITFFRLLGSGVFGRTYLCKIDGVSGLFVVKLYRQAILGYITKERSEKHLKSDCLELDSHPNIVPILFHSKSEKIVLSQLPDFEEYWKQKLTNYDSVGGMLIMKYHHLSLQSLITKRRLLRISNSLNDLLEFETFSPSELMILMKGILSGVYHLHKNRIVHRDLHPGNIFVHPGKGRVLIGDYGCCLDLRNNLTEFRVHKDHEILYSVSGSERYFKKTGGARSYCAPEILNFDSSKNNFLDYSKSDLYSCGLLGKELFDLLDERVKIKKENLFWEESESFFDFLQLLMLDFEDRITFKIAIVGMKEFEKGEDSDEEIEVMERMLSEESSEEDEDEGEEDEEEGEDDY